MHAWNAKHPNGISVIHVIEDIMILFVFEKKNFFNCRIYMRIQSYFPSQKHSIYGGTARQNHWGGTGESGWRSKGLIRKAETLQVLRNCIRLWTTCPGIKQVIQVGLHSPLARCMKNKQKTFWQLKISIFGEDDKSWYMYLDYLIKMFTIAKILKAE